MQREVLIHTVRVLRSLGVDHMLTGSVVSSAQGVPRPTHGVDLVVVISCAAVQPP